MDGAVLATLFLTGSCVLSSHLSYYYFIEDEMTWLEAQTYCISKYTAMAQVQNVEDATAMNNITTGMRTDKAWIGLFANGSEWTWVNGKRAINLNWGNNEEQIEFCAAMNGDGTYSATSCSDKKPFVCEAGDQYVLYSSSSTWNDAKTTCEVDGNVLISVSSSNTNFEIMSAYDKDLPAWIGLYRRKLWYWSEFGENNKLMNWQNGQPDNLNTSDSCAAVVLTDGRWTDEQCDAKYPFFCSGEVYGTRITVLRMKIHSSEDMEDPAHSADLLEQWSAALAQQGLTDFQLSWKRLPRKL